MRGESMELIRDHWTSQDGKEFQNYLLSLSKGKDKGDWEQRIINTKMPCIAVPSKEVGDIVKKIAKGNFMEFIDLWIWEYFTNTSIIGNLICKIKDFDLFKKYLTQYISKCDNWATCDCLRLPVNDKNKQQFFELSKEYIHSAMPFTRRLGITILFKLVDDDKYIDEIFNILNSFEDEKDYYVNMVNAWLVAECFTKQREKTLNFLQTHKLNKFTINKGISKCRDSFRISQEDKDMLVKFRK